MALYDEHARALYSKLSKSNDWLRQRQGLALPVLPPSGLKARQYFFSQHHQYALLAANRNQKSIDYIGLARDWNKSADGHSRFYVTSELLQVYAKTWAKATNIRASQELFSNELGEVRSTEALFQAPHHPFPDFLTENVVPEQPSQGILDLDPSENHEVPPSLSIALPQSLPIIGQQANPSASFCQQTIPDSLLEDHFDVYDFISVSN